MGMRDWISRTFGRKSFSVVMQVGDDGFMKAVAYTGSDLEKLFTQTVWTYICAQRISQDIASIPAIVQTWDPALGEWVKDPEHQLNQILEKPYGNGPRAPRWDWSQMLATGVLRQELSGNQFLRITQSGNRLLALGLQLATVKPPEGASATIPTRYLIGTAGDYVLASEIVNIMHASPGSYWDGISPVVAAQQAVHVDYSVSRRVRYDLETRVAPGVVFKVKGLFSMNKERKEAAEAWLAEQFGKASAAGKSMVVGDDVEVHDPPTRAIDDLPTHHANARDAILSAFGVSPPVVGVLRDVRYQSWDQALRAQWALCIRPRLLNIYRTVNTQAVTPAYGPKVRLWFDVVQSPLGLAFIREQTETAEGYYKFGYPANDLNRHFGFGLPYHEELEKPNMPTVVAGHAEDVGDESGSSPDQDTGEDQDQG